MFPRVFALLRSNEPLAVMLAAKNLIRFATWQSLLTVPLALVVARTALRTPGPLRALVVGLAATPLATALLMAFQGHGWGYRYMHGLIGSVCLLAAFGWMRLTEHAGGHPTRGQTAVFAAALAASVLVLLPWRAGRSIASSAPLRRGRASAYRPPTLTSSLVDDAPVAYGVDFRFRNDPLWSHRPVVLGANELTTAQLTELCRRGRVAVYSSAQAHAAWAFVCQHRSRGSPRRVGIQTATWLRPAAVEHGPVESRNLEMTAHHGSAPSGGASRFLDANRASRGDNSRFACRALRLCC